MGEDGPATSTDLGEDEVRTICHAVIALLQSPTEFHSGLDRRDLSSLLRRMAMAALLSEQAPRSGRRSRATATATSSSRTNKSGSLSAS